MGRSCAHRLNANSNSTVYWLIRNIYAAGLVDKVREEIAPWARRREADGGVEIDWQGLTNRSPLFKACYFESLRLDSAPWSFKRLQKDASVQEEREGGAGSKGNTATAAKFQLRQGDAVLVPADLHHTDPRFFEDASAFRPERFYVRHDSAPELRAEIKTIRPYGGGSTMCKGRILAEREVLAAVAAILVCWDLEPAPGCSWDFDERLKTSGVCKPGQDLRVRLIKRKV